MNYYSKFMKKCKYKNNGKVCGAETVIHPNPEIKGKMRLLCKNPKCDRYYLCSCGKQFGKHHYD